MLKYSKITVWCQKEILREIKHKNKTYAFWKLNGNLFQFYLQNHNLLQSFPSYILPSKVGKPFSLTLSFYTWQQVNASRSHQYFFCLLKAEYLYKKKKKKKKKNRGQPLCEVSSIKILNPRYLDQRLIQLRGN